MKTAVERLFLNLIAPFDNHHLKIMVDNNFYVIDTIRWSASGEQAGPSPEGMSEEEHRLFIARRHGMTKMAVTALGFFRTFASRFSREAVKNYLNPEYAQKYFREHRPDLVVLETSEGYKWLKNEIEYDLERWLWPY